MYIYFNGKVIEKLTEKLCKNAIMKEINKININRRKKIHKFSV